MAKKICILALITILFSLSSPWIDPVAASLPNGNRLKDPYAILRNSLPIDQKELRELQNKLEDTSEDLRGSRWSAISKATSRSQFLVSNRKNQILDSIPEENREKAVTLLFDLNEELDELRLIANEKDKVSFLDVRRQSLKTIDDLESLLITNNFPYKIPNEYDNLPRLLGRANVEIKTSKGNMNAIIDGYNAPLTAGAFIDLSLKGFFSVRFFSQTGARFHIVSIFVPSCVWRWRVFFRVLPLLSFHSRFRLTLPLRLSVCQHPPLGLEFPKLPWFLSELGCQTI